MNKITKMKFLIPISCLLAAVISSVGFADEGVIKYRQAVYTAIGGHMSAMASIIRGDVPNDRRNASTTGYTEDLVVHANAIYKLSGIVPRFFPEGSGKGKTQALPAIWSKNQDFQQRMKNFREAARLVTIASRSSDMEGFSAHFSKLGKECKGCHDNYKAD